MVESYLCFRKTTVSKSEGYFSEWLQKECFNPSISLELLR